MKIVKTKACGLRCDYNIGFWNTKLLSWLHIVNNQNKMSNQKCCFDWI